MIKGYYKRNDFGIQTNWKLRITIAASNIEELVALGGGTLIPLECRRLSMGYLLHNRISKQVHQHQRYLDNMGRVKGKLLDSEKDTEKNYKLW